MAYSTLVSLANTLHYFAIEDKYHIFGDADDANRRPFQSLFDNVVFLRDFLEKFTGKARKLEAQIGHFANEVECFIEYYISDMISSYGHVSGKDIDKLISEINESEARNESIVREVKEIVMNASHEDSSHPYLPRNSDKVVHGKQVIVGLEDDLSKIKDRLFSNDSELVITPIVGMGGIGKSTLAKAAFDDPAVVRRFDRRCWVTISYNHDIRAAYLAILGDDSGDESTDIVELSIRVHQFLYGRRYLIVIDDVWKSDVWDDMIRVLSDRSNGSRVLLTTRDENVASYAVSSGYIHYLKFMDEETSWRLFERMVFGEERCPPELESIGKDIIEGCHGLPLAISVVSGILSNIECASDVWNEIAEDVNRTLSNSDEHFTEILSLSYYRLPTHLKPCFLYFAGFPEVYIIRVSTLVRFWISDGFLNDGNEANDVEAIANECFEHLVRRNLILVDTPYHIKEVRYCWIHDVLREICIRIAKEENFFLYHNEDASLGMTRRTYFTSRMSNYTTMTYESPIRVALCFQVVDYSLLKYLQGFRLLRVLDVRSLVFKKFPDQCLQLYHLRYLALCYDGLSCKFRVPIEICQLENLECFIVQKVGIPSLLVLPEEIWGMSNLRVLKIEDAVMHPPLPKMSRLKNLKKFARVFNLKFDQHLVELIPSVEKMKLYIPLGMELSETWSHYHLHNLKHMSHLMKLNIVLSADHYNAEWCKENPFLQSIKFPHSLRNLSIFGTSPCISWEDVNNVIGSLPNLEILTLSNVFIDCVWKTKEETFMKLRKLWISDQNLERWISETSSYFPSLEVLQLGYCKRLIELPDCISDIPSLTTIIVEEDQPIIYDWTMQIEEKQRDNGNDEFTIIRRGVYEGYPEIFREVFEPTGESISTDELAKKLKLWAGNDGMKFNHAFRAGRDYVCARFERREVPISEFGLFQDAMGYFMEEEEDNDEDEEDNEEEEEVMVEGGIGGG